ncbi:MAG: PadR family transcriptional regulator [Gammaproteobacteria bacterium]|nr:PadR family transcriptional regulator [Gammaproteobacteria bacterium]
MDVKTVCLGMLTDGEASGYDLKKHFEQSFGHFFAAGYGSIYPALASLAEKGLVNCREIPQDGKPDRKVYSITDAGRAHLLKELEKPDPSHKVRSEFLAMVCFAHLMTDEQVRQLLDNRLAAIDEIEAMLDQFECNCMRSTPAGMQFTVGFGRAVYAEMKKYILANGDLLLADKQAEQQSATG